MARRIRCHFVLKTCGISAFIWIFFIVYFELLHHPAHPVTLMPLTVLDRMIPFQALGLAPYLSLWLYLGIAPGLLVALRDLIGYALWIAALCGVGMACFYAWPTAVPPLEFDISSHPGFALLKGVDATGNACPSMHVATAMFTAIWIEHLLRQLQVPWALRLANAVWFTAIAYATLATKQHVLLDVLAGATLGAGFALAALRWRPEPASTGPL